MNGVAEAQPGNYLAGMDINGMYALPVAPGSYTVQGQPVLYHTITTAPHAITIAANQIDPLNHIGYQIIPGIHDLVVDINAAPARPGFNNNVYLSVQNIGTEPTTATIALNFDADQSFVGSSIATSSRPEASVQWTVPLASGSSWSATVTVNTSASVPLGTAILHTLSATPSSPDFAPADNTENLNAVVVGSYDPNDKLASPGSMSPAQVTAGHAIEYTIRFQNTGTYQAERVEITDQLSASLQWNTLEYVSSSHSNFWYLSNGQLHVVFENIDLPHSAANEPNSHGFVKFRITPANSLVVGNTISNTANIFFDFNPPIITDPVVVPIVPETGQFLSAKAFLGGCYDPTTGQMRDDLRRTDPPVRGTIFCFGPRPQW